MADGASAFLRRWARLKSTGGAEQPAPPAPLSAAAPAPAPPTLEDIAQLGADADFSRFVAPGVDGTVRRLALKKLFADPHFAAPDGLDIYMGDYTRADPIPAAMMAALQHARNVFGRARDDDDPAATSHADPSGADKTDPAEPAGTDPAEPGKTDPAEPAGADPGTLAPQQDHVPGGAPSDPATTPDPDDITV